MNDSKEANIMAPRTISLDFSSRRLVLLTVSLFLTLLVLVSTSSGQTVVKQGSGLASKESQITQEAKGKQVRPAGPIDEFDRGVPRGTVKGFLAAAGAGDYEKAAHYLDLRKLRGKAAKTTGPKLAQQLSIVLDRTLWIDPDEVSSDPKGEAEDGLRAHHDSLGRIETPEETVDVLLKHGPRDDGVLIWKFSKKTVAKIPSLYRYHGYSPMEERLSEVFPDIVFLGWQSWQWVALVVFMVAAYIVAIILTWGAGAFVRRRGTEMSRRVASFITGPTRILLWWMLIVWLSFPIIGLSATLRKAEKAGTLYIIITVWFACRLVDLIIKWMTERFIKSGQESSTVLLRPLRTALKIVIIIVAAVAWLDSVGFHVTTLLAGLGVGGLAVALACQDTLKNLIGSVMILLDKPYRVGQRIVVKGHDGVVEEIGLRSTKLRLLTGHQTTIPNDEMAKADIENIGRRPHIRRLANIAIPNNTPLEKIERAVRIIEEILDNHEGMAPEFPPRVYFNEFRRDALNIMVLYWYHPADYWAFLDLNQRVNRQILQEFEREGIKLALPSTATFLSQGDEKPLLMDITRRNRLTEPDAS
jgi:MscS family membrane protein